MTEDNQSLLEALVTVAPIVIDDMRAIRTHTYVNMCVLNAISIWSAIVGTYLALPDLIKYTVETGNSDLVNMLFDLVNSVNGLSIDYELGTIHGLAPTWGTCILTAKGCEFQLTHAEVIRADDLGLICDTLYIGDRCLTIAEYKAELTAEKNELLIAERQNVHAALECDIRNALVIY